MSSKNQQRKWKTAGLCPTCGKPRDNPNRQECNACAKYHSDYVKQANRYYQSLHICPVCKTNRLESGQKRCSACKEMMKERHIRYGYDKAKVREYTKSRRERLKGQDLCVICGKVEPIAGQTLCEACKARAKELREQRKMENAIKYISKKLGKEEVLTQLAEEASEVVQAALKLRRAMNGINPTPIDEKTAWENVKEKLADIQVCQMVLFESDTGDDGIYDIADKKLVRWEHRLKNGAKM